VSGLVVTTPLCLVVSRRTARHILEFVFRSVVNYKCVTHDPSALDSLLDTAGKGESAAAAPASPSRAITITDVYQTDLAAPTAGPAGMRPGVAAGFSSATKPPAGGGGIGGKSPRAVGGGGGGGAAAGGMFG
jgi:hypothetical protein